MAREKAANNKSAKVKAAELLAQMGNQPSPIDEETICESVRKTGRAVIVHEARPEERPQGISALVDLDDEQQFSGRIIWL